MPKKSKAPLLALLFTANTCFGYDPLSCVNDIARVDNDISVGLATKLCSGSWSYEPVACYKAVSLVDKGMIRGIAIDLCAGSVDAEKTVACYAEAAQRYNRGIATTLSTLS